MRWMVMVTLVGCSQGVEINLPSGVTADWVAQACAVSECKGPNSRAVVMRDAQGAAQSLFVMGDDVVCSHSPSVYVSRTGEALGWIAGGPIPEGETFDSLHAPYAEGLTRSEAISNVCSGD